VFVQIYDATNGNDVTEDYYTLAGGGIARDDDSTITVECGTGAPGVDAHRILVRL
jgi:hypothetical protein